MIGYFAGYKSKISIHALREERDPCTCCGFAAAFDFNPRAPRGARLGCRLRCLAPCRFQSTRSARSATIFPAGHYVCCINFNPRAPRGARLEGYTADKPVVSDFNPRAPRGARPERNISFPKPAYFNPRAPRGARQAVFASSRFETDISIHALREERDYTLAYFGAIDFVFQSTRSARSATIRSPSIW